jgi:hypothetical protein
MKTLTNNQSNELLFIDNKTLLSTIVEGELIQLGSTDSTPIPISIKSVDCFTITYEVSLESNQLRNATYLLNVLNPDGGIISSTTVRVDGNTEPNRAYVVLDSGTASSNSGTGGSTGGSTTGSPVIYASSKYYIQLDEAYTLNIPVTNSPTSYSVFGLIDGLSFDTTTGRITGTVTGADRLESMYITATNDLGSDSKLIYFQITNEDPSILHPPDNYRVNEVRTSSWYFIGWEYRPYSGEIESTTTYKNGVQYRVSVNGGNGRRYVGVPVPNLTDIVNTYQSKFTDTNGNVSRYSDRLLVNGIEAQHITYFESVSTYENLLSVPTIKPTQIYYIQKDVSFEFDVNSFIHNNPTSYYLSSYFSTGTNSDGGTYELAGSFDEDTGILTSLATGDLSGFDKYGNLTGIQATNDNGTSVSEYIKFKYVDYNPNELRKPTNVILETAEEDFLTWEYDRYNKSITEIEIYKNDVLLKIVINNNTKSKVIGTGVDNTSGDTWKIRFRDLDGLYSEFSDTI